MQQNKIILVGAFSEMIELCEDCGYQIFGYIDIHPINGIQEGIKYLGSDDDADRIFSMYGEYPLVITPDKPALREIIFKKYSKIGFNFQTIICSTARISKTAKIGKGTVIQHGVNISSNVVIGDFVKLNVNANVMHDCVIDNYSTIAPNAVLLGKVYIGNRTYIGANATILPNCSLSSDVMVGAGSVVTKDVVKEGLTVKGIPAK